VGRSSLPLTVLVDNVRSLWNVGSIFRTADACAVRTLYLAGITGHPPRPEISKTALGADSAVDWHYSADPLESLERVVADGYTPVAIETSPEAVPLGRVSWPPTVCLVVGNEVAGVSPPVLKACPLHVSIPMLGTKESLNVAVAFGIAAYEVVRSLNGGGNRAREVRRAIS
jgi:tRNA G18 (ribose-2'-O)-methylase SpoU